MTAILGIDAAWTTKQPSGVALLRETEWRSWACVAVAPSYQAFLQTAYGHPIDWPTAKVYGSVPSAEQLLSACRTLLDGDDVAAIAIDMPLSRTPIVARREADNAVSRRFGAQGCAVHSPTVNRPGEVSSDLTREFESLGYPLVTEYGQQKRGRALIEVFPHIALLTLLHRDFRVPYKTSRSNSYWPNTPPAERCSLLLREFRAILKELSRDISNHSFCLPLPTSTASLASLKRYEDALDALVCAWIGIQFFKETARAYGDRSGAIWGPGG